MVGAALKALPTGRQALKMSCASVKSGQNTLASFVYKFIFRVHLFFAMTNSGIRVKAEGLGDGEMWLCRLDRLFVGCLLMSFSLHRAFAICRTKSPV